MAKINDILLHLLSEKNTDRKNAASKLELLVKERNVILTLDRNTLNNQGNKDSSLTWDNVIQRVSRYVLIEVENTKITSAESYKKKVKEVAGHYKSVITAAEKRGSIIKSSHVYKHILMVLKHDNCKEYFLEIYSTILLKSLLSKKKHIHDIGDERWHELVEIYCNLLHKKGDTKEDKGIHNVLYASVLQKLLQTSSSMPYMQTENLLLFFEEVFLKNRNWNITLLEVLISSLNSFSWVCCVEHRKDICALGEHVIPVFLTFWKYKAHNVKTQLLDFFRNQLLVHSFSKDALHGKCNSDYTWLNENWKKITKDLFELIYIEVSNIKSSHSSRKDGYQQKLQTVAANLIQQMMDLLREGDDSFTFSSKAGKEHKRCKISVESPWNAVLDVIQTHADVESKIMWLQVIEKMFTLNGSCINASRATQLLNTLQNMMIATKNDDVLKWLLIVTIACMKNVSFPKCHVESMKNSTRAIQKLSLKHINNTKFQDYICALSCVMIKKGLIAYSHEIFKIFTIDGVKVCRESLVLLLTVIQSRLFPEELCRYLPEELETLRNPLFPLRTQLLTWLGGNAVKEDTCQILQHIDKDNIKEMAELVGTCLAKCPISVTKSTFEDSVLLKSSSCNDGRHATTHAAMIRQLLLATTFDWDLNIAEKYDGRKDASTIKKQCVEVEFEKEVSSFLKGIAEYIAESPTLTCDVENCVKTLMFFVSLEHVVITSYGSVALVQTLQSYVVLVDKKLNKLLQSILGDEKMGKDDAKRLYNTLEWIEYALKSCHGLGVLMKNQCTQLLRFLMCLMTGKGLASSHISSGNSSTSPNEDFMECDGVVETNSLDETGGDDIDHRQRAVVCSCTILAHVLFQPHLDECDRKDFMIQLEQINGESTSLQMLVAINEMLKTTKRNHLSSSELAKLVNLTQKVLSVYRNDQEVCLMLLDGIIYYVQVIQTYTPDNYVEQAGLVLVQLMEIFVSLGRQKYSPVIRCKIADVLLKLSKMSDDGGMWKLEVNNDTSEKRLTSAIEILVQWLNEDCFTVQLHVVLRLGKLLVHIPNSQLKKYRRMLTKTFENLAFVKQTNSTTAYNNMVICLLLIKKVLCNCPVLEKQVLSVLFKLITENRLKVNLVYKIMLNASRELKYVEFNDYVRDRIDYVIYDYVVADNDPRNFPAQAIGMSFAEFMRHFGESHVIPCLVAHCKFVGIENLLHTVWANKSSAEVLRKGFSRVSFLTLLSYFKNNTGENLSDAETVALSGLEKYREIVGVEYFNKTLQEQSQDIILHALLHLCDPCEEESYTRCTRSHLSHPLLTSAEVQSFISNLALCYGEKKKPVSILIKPTDSIPRILASLSNSMLKSNLLSMKLSLLQAYFYFVNFLMDEFASVEKTCGHYTTRSVLYSCIYLLWQRENWEQSEQIIRLTFDVMSLVLSKIFMSVVVAEEVSRTLGFLVNNLICFATTYKDYHGNRSSEMLQQLILNGTVEMESFGFTEAVASLHMFPKHGEMFVAFNERLRELKLTVIEPEWKKELRRLLKTLKDMMSLSPLVCLQKIHIFLRKTTSNITPCCEVDNMASYLVEKSKYMCDDSKLLVVQCLEIVGMVGLSNHSDVDEKSEDGKSLLQKILERLSTLCCDIDTVTAKVAVQCLKGILEQSKYREKVSGFQHEEFVSYLTPFLASRREKGNNGPAKHIPENLRCEYTSLFRGRDLQISGDVKYATWIRALCEVFSSCAAIREHYFVELLPLCLINMEFSEFCLPLLMYYALKAEDTLREVFSEVFRVWMSTFLAYDIETKKHHDVQKKMSQVLNIILELRRASLNAQRNEKVVDYWNYNSLLNVDYSQVAEVAYHCSSYHAAALCLELSTDSLSTASVFMNVGKSDDSTQEFDVSSVDSNTSTGKQFKTLLYDIYKNIGDVDVLYGVVDCAITDIDARPKIYEMEKNYSKALLASDIQNSRSESQRLILENLLNSGLHQTSLIYLNGLPEENIEKLTEFQFEVAWRNSVWDTSQFRDGHPRDTSFHGNIYYSLQSLKNGSEDLLETYLRNCQLSVITSDHLEKIPLKTIVASSYLAQNLQKFCQSLIRNDHDELKFPVMPHDNFDNYEATFAVLFEALKIAHVTDTTEQTDLLDVIVSFGKNVCKMARENKRFEVSEKLLSQLRMINEETKLSPDWQLEEAELFWAKGETRSAMQLLKHLMKGTENRESENVAPLHPVVMSLYGHWLGETRSQSPVFIMEKYLQPAIEKMESRSYEGNHSPIHAYHTLARYASIQYKNTSQYIKSDICEKKKAVVSKNRTELKRYTDGRPSTEPNVKRHYHNLEKQCVEDEKEIEQAVCDQKKFLHKAIYNYCKCLECGDKFDLKIIRLCSLWFEEFSDREVNENLNEALDRIESRKLLPIIYQVAARLGTAMTSQCKAFKDNIEKIIVKCITEHPHHSVFVLLALCHANMDQKIVAKQKTGRISQKHLASIDAQDKNRIDAACAVLDQLRSKKGHYVQTVEHLSTAYIELAYWNIAHLKKESGPFELPHHKQLKKIANLSTVSVPSIDLKVDPSLEYKDIVYISKFENTFSHCGGVNLPKIVTCICSDGVRRRQLIKGRDDLRQDAVMQQVFGAVNALLQNDSDTRRRHLKMRTYKVVPLSKKSGLMEWCEGTMPLGNYLISGRGPNLGAHQRYYPNDWSPLECRKKLAAATVHGDDENSKYQVFLDIERNFQPVLRHFFLEKFLEPSSWYSKRIAYTKSTAVSSIVGYVVGLGDRHCQNILIDYNSAEVVHIDLGVAFEQGKLLPTPETIPFRLTRDIVDGMGIIGIEGVFRRTCEKTMEVMRKSEEAISTIVEVLLYDPLSAWTITSEKASRLQTKQMNDTTSLVGSDANATMDTIASVIETDKNKMAERVLLRLQQKLSGNEGGSFLGVEGQVNYLIQEARDTQNLCRLFPGWQPWL